MVWHTSDHPGQTHHQSREQQPAVRHRKFTETTSSTLAVCFELQSIHCARII
jgi:hypothetical protein